MRTSRKLSLIGALAAIAALVVGTTSFADTATQGTVTQGIELGVSPSKLPKKADKKKPAEVSLFTEVEISSTDAVNKIPSANKVTLTYDKDLTFNRKGVATCDQTQIEGVNNADAQSACKKAVVGSGAAAASCAPGPPGITGIKVLAFNSKDGILLHSDANLGGTSTITIIPGSLKGNVITFTVPPLAGGACSIQLFNATLGKGETDKKTKNYITGTCKDKSISVDGKFDYNANPQGVTSLSPTDAVTCKQKK